MYLSVSSSNFFRSTLKLHVPGCKGETAYSTDTSTSTYCQSKQDGTNNGIHMVHVRTGLDQTSIFKY